MIVVLAEGGGGNATGRALEAGLRSLGVDAVVGPLPTSGEEVAAVLVDLESAVAPLEAVVLASAGVSTTHHGELAGLDATQWRQRVELPLQRTVACFQGVHRRLAAGGGSLVVLVPTLALVGASGYGPWATVAEAQRSLAKSAARAWGGEAITVNCVAVPAALLRSSTTAMESEDEDPDRPGQPPPALDESPELEGRVAALVASLVAGPWRGVTGATIAVDAGVWMTP
jgi:NAD(P)-dependent dehydrogenase (short-subunit alcohol dehydrogenase family)